MNTHSILSEKMKYFKLKLKFSERKSLLIAIWSYHFSLLNIVYCVLIFHKTFSKKKIKGTQILFTHFEMYKKHFALLLFFLFPVRVVQIFDQGKLKITNKFKKSKGIVLVFFKQKLQHELNPTKCFL